MILWFLCRMAWFVLTLPRNDKTNPLTLYGARTHEMMLLTSVVKTENLEGLSAQMNDVMMAMKAFKGRDPVRTKIVIDNKIIEKVNLFNYLGNISYETQLDTDNKLHNYLKITDILNNVFR